MVIWLVTAALAWAGVVLALEHLILAWTRRRRRGDEITWGQLPYRIEQAIDALTLQDVWNLENSGTTELRHIGAKIMRIIELRTIR